MQIALWLLVGLIGGAAYLFYGRQQGVESENKVFATGLLIAAIIYVGFGLLWGDVSWVSIEMAGVLLYGVFAYLGFRKHALWLAFGWLMHVGWDIGLHLFGPGAHIVPAWYAYACISFDVLMAGYIGFQFWVSRSEFQVREQHSL